MSDPVKPQHYRAHPSGVECITVTEHMTFCLGNAVKYIWRAGLKGDAVEDLRKARYYVDREIERLEWQRANGGATTPGLFDLIDAEAAERAAGLAAE